MGKKSFKDINPAAAFISSAHPPTDTEYTHNTDYTQYTHDVHDMPIARSENPAPYGATRNETKSKRLNLLIRPTLLQDFSKVAHMKRASVNSLLNMLIATTLHKRRKLFSSITRPIKECDNMAVEKIYTLTEVIEMLKITRRSFYRYIEAGSLNAVKIARRWYVKESALQEFLDRGTGTQDAERK